MIVQLRASYLFPLFLAGFVQSNSKLEKVSDHQRGWDRAQRWSLLSCSQILPSYAGKHVLFVNVATYCGLTAQYSEMSALQEELKPFDLVVLGFPCNQFGKYVRPGGGYVPNFQLFEKGDVNGEKEQKVFTFLKQSCPHPSELMGSIKHLSWEPIMAHDIRWNFEKFLVGPDGVPVTRWFHQAPVSTVKSDILADLKQLKIK
uniref:Glutathione peroxidase n=1 Tax=Phocoena sinus TaxID=42100 RepID=A0A8C9CHA5_PHOSS